MSIDARSYTRTVYSYDPMYATCVRQIDIIGLLDDDGQCMLRIGSMVWRGEDAFYDCQQYLKECINASFLAISREAAYMKYKTYLNYLKTVWHLRANR